MSRRRFKDSSSSKGYCDSHCSKKMKPYADSSGREKYGYRGECPQAREYEGYDYPAQRWGRGGEFGDPPGFGGRGFGGRGFDGRGFGGREFGGRGFREFGGSPFFFRQSPFFFRESPFFFRRESPFLFRESPFFGRRRF